MSKKPEEFASDQAKKYFIQLADIIYGLTNQDRQRLGINNVYSAIKNGFNVYKFDLLDKCYVIDSKLWFTSETQLIDYVTRHERVQDAIKSEVNVPPKAKVAFRYLLREVHKEPSDSALLKRICSKTDSVALREYMSAVEEFFPEYGFTSPQELIEHVDRLRANPQSAAPKAWASPELTKAFWIMREIVSKFSPEECETLGVPRDNLNNLENPRIRHYTSHYAEACKKLFPDHDFSTPQKLIDYVNEQAQTSPEIRYALDFTSHARTMVLPYYKRCLAIVHYHSGKSQMEIGTTTGKGISAMSRLLGGHVQTSYPDFQRFIHAEGLADLNALVQKAETLEVPTQEEYRSRIDNRSGRISDYTIRLLEDFDALNKEEAKRTLTRRSLRDR